MKVICIEKEYPEVMSWEFIHDDKTHTYTYDRSTGAESLNIETVDVCGTREYDELEALLDYLVINCNHEGDYEVLPEYWEEDQCLQ